MGFFSGRVILCGSKADSTAILSIVQREGLFHERIWTTEEGELWIALSHRAAKRLCELCREERICLATVKRRGLPDLAERYGKRIGMLLGGLSAAALVFFSSRMVWDINIIGNKVYSSGELEQILAQNGLSVGSYLPGLDTDAIENRVLLSHGEIGWISINIKGTTANVELIETARGGVAQDSSANLVAARDGRVERIEVYDGSVCVKVGEVVRDGQVLVSGVYEGGGSLRTTHAKGRVYARTVREFSVEIPLETTKKVYTGREWTEKYVKFFSKRIKVFANSGNVGATCDIIYHNGEIGLSDGVAIPIGLDTVRYREYREQPTVLSGAEAMEKAFDALESRLNTFVTQTGAELLKKTVSYEMDEFSYRLRCEVVCIENIAQTQEIEIN